MHQERSWGLSPLLKLSGYDKIQSIVFARFGTAFNVVDIGISFCSEKPVVSQRWRYISVTYRSANDQRRDIPLHSLTIYCQGSHFLRPARAFLIENKMFCQAILDNFPTDNDVLYYHCRYQSENLLECCYNERPILGFSPLTSVSSPFNWQVLAKVSSLERRELEPCLLINSYDVKWASRVMARLSLIL